MTRTSFWALLMVVFSSCGLLQKPSPGGYTGKVRIATYNTSLYQRSAGGLVQKLTNVEDQQAIKIARIIRQIRPDILLLQEFDYDSSGQALSLFKKHFLTNLTLGPDTIQYKYGRAFPSNTGLVSDVDMNGDGQLKAPEDAYGFGFFEGQYGFAMLSKYPIDTANMRSFQKFLWSDMPGATIPLDSAAKPFYDEVVWKKLRLSSKNHVDLPVILPKNIALHLLLSHPTPPVFDGPEDRNGCRNHDEIRLWKDYINGADYLVDDNGKAGGLAPDAHFVILGDLNADPVDGDSYNNAIHQVLNLERLHQSVALGDLVPASKGGKVYNQKKNHRGDPSEDTSFFGLRVDYVLPDKDWNVTQTGVYWPVDTTGNIPVKKGDPSDHLLVWIDMQMP